MSGSQREPDRPSDSAVAAPGGGQGDLHATVIEAAGGVVERETPEGVSIAIIYRERYGPEWALPKGKRQPGETWQQTGLREVEEEIGVRSRITGVVGATAYLADGVPKLVLYWRMHATGHSRPFVPNEEVREIAWLPLPQAIERLSHPEEAHILRMIMQRNSAP